MGYIQPLDRNQLTLPESLDSYISSENPVRLIDGFVDQFINYTLIFQPIKAIVLRDVQLIASVPYSNSICTVI